MGNVKFPAHRAGLPGKDISFLFVPLDPAYKAGLAGHLPVKTLAKPPLKKKRGQPQLANPLKSLPRETVGAAGFEPATTCTPCKYATRLRHAPKNRSTNE